MADLAIQKPTADAPLVLAYVAAAAGGDAFINSGQERLHVKNGGGGAITVTVNAQKNCNHGFAHNAGPTNVAAGAEVTFGRLDTFRFNDGANKAQVRYSAVGGVTVAVEG